MKQKNKSFLLRLEIDLLNAFKKCVSGLSTNEAIKTLLKDFVEQKGKLKKEIKRTRE